MGMPEFVVMHGVKMAWTFLQKNLDYALGYLLRELPVNRQEEYRNLVRNDDVSIVFGYPGQTPRIPQFSILLQNESEDAEGQFLGDAGLSNRALPHPMVNQDIEMIEDFYGIVYSTEDNQSPSTLGIGGDTSKDQVRQYSPSTIYPDTGGDDANATGQPVGTVFPKRKNYSIQRQSGTTGDEQFELMGQVQRLYPRDGQRLFSTTVGDRVSMGIVITTQSAEKTFVYYRLLRWVLRRFSTWFIRNGVLNPVFSGDSLVPNEGVMPTVGVVFQRTLTISFLHHDISVEVESVLADFMLNYEMAVRKQDGTLDVTSFTVKDS